MPGNPTTAVQADAYAQLLDHLGIDKVVDHRWFFFIIHLWLRLSETDPLGLHQVVY
jgi:hypothetical protein